MRTVVTLIRKPAHVMSGSSILDRISSPKLRSSMLGFRPPPEEPPNEYQLHELDPKPEYPEMSRDYSYENPRHPEPPFRDKSADAWSTDAPSSADSPFASRRRSMFRGPPPPIAGSVMKTGRSQGSSEAGRSQGIVAASTAQLGSLLFHGPPRQQNQVRPDSAWRAFNRRERALEEEIQQLLDLQATGLIAGSGRPPEDRDGYSDTGSSTPTGTFYSTATSKSRMLNSLHIPARANKDGNVIPVRQPTGGKPLGLRSARAGLRKAMAALVELKQEEDAHVDAALSERKKALVHLSRLSVKRNGIGSELQTLEDDEEEPLGKEIRELGTKYNSLTQEIRQLEERLMAMRNQRKSVRERMEEVQNRRDAGLSGYRGALKDIDNEMQWIMMHPPVQPLDPEVFTVPGLVDDEEEYPGGMEFLKLVPDRRTAALARSWWEREVTILDKRRRQISRERQALEDGSAVWREVTTLVTSFESSLRHLMKTGSSPVPESAKGKEKAPSQETIIKEQLAKMDDVVAQLETCLNRAESEGWNLLVCAVGAELEAFREAQDMLKSVVEDDAPLEDDIPEDKEEQEQQHNAHEADESDNEVPTDLLVSTADASTKAKDGGDAAKAPARLHRADSENDVPPEFLEGWGKED